jgi:hypothetical protein
MAGKVPAVDAITGRRLFSGGIKKKQKKNCGRPSNTSWNNKLWYKAHHMVWENGILKSFFFFLLCCVMWSLTHNSTAFRSSFSPSPFPSRFSENNPERPKEETHTNFDLRLMVLGRLPVGQGDNNVQLSFGKCKNSKKDGHRKKKISWKISSTLPDKILI